MYKFYFNQSIYALKSKDVIFHYENHCFVKTIHISWNEEAKAISNTSFVGSVWCWVHKWASVSWVCKGQGWRCSSSLSDSLPLKVLLGDLNLFLFLYMIASFLIATYRFGVTSCTYSDLCSIAHPGVIVQGHHYILLRNCEWPYGRRLFRRRYNTTLLKFSFMQCNHGHCRSVGTVYAYWKMG
jgi:hypothetical protein